MCARWPIALSDHWPSVSHSLLLEPWRILYSPNSLAQTFARISRVSMPYADNLLEEHSRELYRKSTLLVSVGEEGKVVGMNLQRRKGLDLAEVKVR